MVQNRETTAERADVADAPEQAQPAVRRPRPWETPDVEAPPTSATAVPGAPGRGRVPGLDGLRGVALLAVLVYHFWPWALPGGFLGVDLFFVLSGFLITAGLHRALRQDGRVDLREFWLRRARRLVPALLLVMTTATALSLLAGTALPARLRDQWIAALTWTSNWQQLWSGDSYVEGMEPPLFQHLWSLAVEEQFYLVWPLLLMLVWTVARTTTRRIAIVLALAALSALSMRVLHEPGTDPTGVYLNTFTHGFGLLLGAAAAMVAHHLPEPSARSTARRVARDVVAVGLAAGLLAAFVLATDTADSTYRVVMPLFSGAAAVLVVLLVRSPGLVGRVLEHERLQWVGVRSYGLYLAHWPFLVLAGLVVPEDLSWLGLALALAATFAMASWSWRAVELPVLRRGFRGAMRWWVAGRRPYTVPRRVGAVLVTLALASGCATAAGAAITRSPERSSLEDQLAAGQAAISGAPAPEASPQPKADAADRRPAEGGDVTAVGDSVMLAAAPALLRRLPGIHVSATVGAQIWDVPDLLRRFEREGRLRDVVVLGLGANGAAPRKVLDEIAAIVGPERRLVLVTAHADKPWAKDMNRTYKAFAKADDTTYLADWDAVAGGVDDFAPDGVHPGPRGSRVYAKAVANVTTNLSVSRRD